MEAAEAARAAAVVLAERLNSKGRAAFVKSMTFSQVWCGDGGGGGVRGGGGLCVLVVECVGGCL